MAMADSTKQKHCPKKRIARKDYSREVVSPSLLAQIDVRDPKKKISKEFSLGMSEWMDADDENDKENSVSSSDYDDSSNHLMLRRLDSTVFVT